LIDRIVFAADLPENYFWEPTVACRAPRLGTMLTVVTGF
jgi:hypothetical protein